MKKTNLFNQHKNSTKVKKTADIRYQMLATKNNNKGVIQTRFSISSMVLFKCDLLYSHF